MTVQPQLVPIPFTGGLDTKTDPKQVLAGHLLELENGQFLRQGQISKRFGYDVLGRTVEGGGTINAAKAISAYGDELVLFDGKRVYTLLEATGNWSARGTAISVIASDRQVIRNTSQQLNPDVAYASGVEVYAWEDSRGGIRYAVVDAETRAFAVSDGLVDANGQKPKCVTFGGTVLILYTDGINTLYVRTVSPANPTLITVAAVVLNDAFAGFGFDATVVGSKLFIGYLSVNGAVDRAIQLSAYDMALALVGTVVVENTAGHSYHNGLSFCITVAGTAAQNVWITWFDGHDQWVGWYTYTLSLGLANFRFGVPSIVNTVSLMESPTDTDSILVAVEGINNNEDTQVLLAEFDAAGAGAVVGELRSVGLASKYFSYGSEAYINVSRESPLQSTYFTILADASLNCPVIAKVSATVGGGLRTNNQLSEVAQPTPGVFLWANLTKGKDISEANTLFALLGVTATSLDFAHANKFLSVTQSGALLYVGGILQGYDGVSATELGYHQYPEGLSLDATGSDGFLESGSYEYCAVYEWTDNMGQVHRSAPSVPTQVDVNATNHVTVTVPTLRLTQKQSPRSPVSIVIYRTQADGQNFNRVTSTLAPLQNDTTVDTLDFVDTMSDADALSNELLYTTGDVLANAAPPANSLICIYQGRVVVSGLEDPNLLWFSKNKFDNSNFNTIPTEFAAELTIGCDPRGGPITALGVIDDKLIIFKRAAIFVVSGDGPNDTGGGAAFGDPQFVSTDVGCRNPNSVVVTPQGLMFQSDKGIYLLDRSLSAQYIGAPVEAFNALEISSSTLDQDANQVIFTTVDGPALVFDYYFSQWSTWTNHEAQDSDSFDASFAFVKANGKVYRQNKSIYTDGGAKVLLSFVTPNFSWANLNGFQRVFRVYLLGSYKGTHTLNVGVAYDYNDVYEQSAVVEASRDVTVWGGDSTWGESSPWGGEYVPYQFRVDFKRQRCSSVRLRISDAQVSGYNEGYAISALTFEVGTMPKGARVPASRTVGTT